MRSVSWRRHHLVILATSAAFAFVLLAPYLGGHWQLADDAYKNDLASLLLESRILREWMWPFWNPNVGLGQPWSISVAAEVFYPPQILWGLTIGWDQTKYLWFIWLHLTAGGWLAATFARRAGLDTAAALFFALAYVGNGLSLGFIENVCLFTPYLLGPLLAAGLVDLHRRPERTRAAVREIAIAFVLIQTGGYQAVTFPLYVFTAVTYSAMTRAPGRLLRGPKWRAAGWATIAAVLVCMPQLVTTLRALPLLDRMNVDIYDQAMFHNVSNFLHLGTLLFPAQFFARDRMQLGTLYLERSWWIGVLTVGFILAGTYTGTLRLSRYRVPIIVGLCSLLLSFGGHSFLREAASWPMPILLSLRHAHLARLFIIAFLCFLGAEAFMQLRRRAEESPAPPAHKRLAVAWGVFLAACAWAALSEVDRTTAAANLYFDPHSGWKIAGLHNGFYLLLAYTTYVTRWSPARTLGWPVFIVVLQFLNLADVGYAFRYVLAERGTPPIHIVTEPFAVASPQPNERVIKNWVETRDWITWENNEKILNVYNPPDHVWLARAKADPRLKPWLSTLASCQDDALAVLGRPPARSWSCTDTRFEIDYDFGNRIEISGSSPTPALLMVHDFFDPGWQARVNGERVEVLKALDYFKAVEIPAGRWTVRFEYRDRLFPALWFVSALGALLVVWVPAAALRSSVATA